jgi:methylase of polypeptide subunit release factors
MASFLPENAGTILEPTPGRGNLVKALESKGVVNSPEDFSQMKIQSFDWIVMNPPFTPISKDMKSSTSVWR